MRKISFQLSAAACAMALASQAHALNVSFSGFAHGAESVTITLASPNVALTESASAGGFLTSVNGGPSFESYCTDVYQSISFGDPAYTDYTQTNAAHVFANSHAYADLGKLYATAGAITNSVHEAAFQIDVWEISYETTGSYNLGSGSASFAGGSAASSGALTLAASWLSSLSASGPAIGVLDSRTHQDVIYAPVPEPSTVLLMVMGLLGIATVARRRGMFDIGLLRGPLSGV